MSAPDLTADLMRSFRASGAESHTTLLLGAGASTTSGLPDWDTFAIRLLMQSKAVSTFEAAELLLSRQDPLIVVEAARAAYGKRWNQKLRAALYEGVASVDPSPLHLAAVGHLLGGGSSLVTLNFDIMLEEAIVAEGEKASSSVDGNAVPDGYTVHHLHGIITPQASEAVVLTLSDFTDLIAEKNSWQLSYLRDAMGRGALIIAGTSYRDPDLRQWLHLALQEKPDHHAALVLLAREGFNLTKDQFEGVERALRSQWTAVGLEPILLQDHSDAAQIIRELRYLQADSYLAPQERAARVWSVHTDRFDELQAEYVDQLEVDASTMRDALDVDRLNLTLWLADGDGRLARWAAQDRIYRDVTSLRRVETGHDSPWIAGKALGSDSLLFQDLEDRHTRQWRSVLAIPVPVPHPVFPSLSAAVLTVGLPRPAEAFLDSSLLWGEPLSEIALAWGTRLSAAAFV